MPIFRRKGSPFLWVRGSVAGEPYKCSTGVLSDTESGREKAEEFEHALRDRIWRRRKLGDKGAVSIKEAAEKWLKTLTNKTRHEDRSKIEWFLNSPDLANITVGGVTVEVNEALQQALLAQSLAPGTVDKYMGVWRRFLRKCALEWGYMPAPPKVPMLNVETAEPRWLTPAEFARLFAALTQNQKAAALFAVSTGLRMRAMLSLKWRNVDLRGQRAWIEKRFMKNGKTHGFPLSSEALRALDMARAAREAQEQAHLRSCKNLGLDPELGDSEHVFTHQCKPLNNCNTKAYQKALRAAQIADADWHTLRHTFASWAVQSGVTLQELMKLGPWESYEMVLVYAHLAPDHLSEAVSRVARFGNQTNTADMK